MSGKKVMKNRRGSELNLSSSDENLVNDNKIKKMETTNDEMDKSDGRRRSSRRGGRSRSRSRSHSRRSPSRRRPSRRGRRSQSRKH